MINLTFFQTDPAWFINPGCSLLSSRESYVSGGFNEAKNTIEKR